MNDRNVSRIGKLWPLPTSCLSLPYGDTRRSIPPPGTNGDCDRQFNLDFDRISGMSGLERKADVLIHELEDADCAIGPDRQGS